MNGWMKNYKISLKNTPGPISMSQYSQVKLDLKGIMTYAKSQGKKVVDLTEEEKSLFIREK